MGKKVEVDVTFLCRSGVIKNPTSTQDDVKDTVWILGIIDSRNKNNFYVKRVPNRKTSTIIYILEGRVDVGSVLTSDGYPSYPGVASYLF